MKIRTLNFFRVVSFIGGTSLLVLLFIAMPLKYLANIPQPVQYVGVFHGIFFVCYILVVIWTTYIVKWSIWWFLISIVVTFIPFGNYILDLYLKKHIHKEKFV
ncbi:DUF3817 domain-containing protein (plasmid) [Niallia circulans]|uniref:DUF3817 domain-containing protein n=1 Tax=Niallia circulans TaxID=1397 RepID=A0A553SQF3_NIACI|nr:DUF3817 domain-containing protein [Niallia circulans]TRZ39220.1 DUF3817 domain-containing protein [Niallia circulans]